MKNLKKLSQAEWEIMEGVWQFSRPVRAREVQDLIYPFGQKAYSTVQTFMNILVKKGFLKRKKIAATNFYKPTISRAEATAMEIFCLVERVFQGSYRELTRYLIDLDKLSEADLAKLKGVIEAKTQKQVVFSGNGSQTGRNKTLVVSAAGSQQGRESV